MRKEEKLKGHRIGFRTNAWLKFHGNSSGSFLIISVWAKVVDQQTYTALEPHMSEARK